MELHLRGKTAIVTGGSRGLGAAVCARLAREGANVLLTYATNWERAEALSGSLRANYDIRTETFRADVSQEKDVEALFAFAAERFGLIDMLINNAGVCPVSPIAETSYEMWNQVMAVNMRRTFS